jgi:hypothetical protein
MTIHDQYTNLSLDRSRKWKLRNPDKNKKIQKKSSKNYREKNHDYYVSYMKQYFADLKRWAVNKLGRKCCDCGLITQYDCVYDFHHEGDDSWCKEGINKTNARIKQLIKWRRADSIPIDVKLICSNCHRIKTVTELQ